MISKRLFIFGSIFFACISFCFAQESDQQINDFSLAGYGEKGKKSWDLSGKSADIFEQVVKLKDVNGNLYGKEEDVNLTSKTGDFNKADGKIHLEKDVVITTSSGTRLTTDTLDWDRKQEKVTTPDKVNITRDNMNIQGRGAEGQMNFNKVALKKDVRVDINPDDKDKEKPSAIKDKIIITCDGPLNVDYEKNLATFHDNVKVERVDSTIYSDIMDIYFLTSKKDEPKQAEENDAEKKDSGLMGSKLDRIVARGNVKVVQGQNTSYSEEAIYTGADKKLTLTGSPRLVIFSTEGFNMGGIKSASSGN